ncbi:MAG: type II secretion system protein [Candidatus Ozemobacteraceae bacterium]
MSVLFHQRVGPGGIGIRRSAFTLIELMIVISIIGILSAIAVPHFSRARDQAREKKCFEFSSLLTRTADLYYIDKKIYAKQVVDLGPYISGDKIPTCPQHGTFQWIPGTENGDPTGQKVRCTIHGCATATFGTE